MSNAYFVISRCLLLILGALVVNTQRLSGRVLNAETGEPVRFTCAFFTNTFLDYYWARSGNIAELLPLEYILFAK